MFFNEDHLRITKVRTLDGITPVFGEDQKPQKKIVFAPNTKDARKLLEDQNTRLPNHLKMTIELVKGYTPAPVVTIDPKISEMEKKIAELEAKNKNLMESHINNADAAKHNDNGESDSDEKKVPKAKRNQHEKTIR